MKITYSLSEIDKVAGIIIENAGSSILLFYGEMGTGKTTLIKAIVKQLGIKDLAGSPTFALVNEYGDENKVYHFDFYRIKNEAEAYDMGFEDYLSSDARICIEWPEKIERLLPDAYTTVHISAGEHGERILVLKNINCRPFRKNA